MQQSSCDSQSVGVAVDDSSPEVAPPYSVSLDQDLRHEPPLVSFAPSLGQANPPRPSPEASHHSQGIGANNNNSPIDESPVDEILADETSDLDLPATILIADSRPQSVETLNRILTDQGYQTIVVNSAAAALGTLAIAAIDLILLDINLPDRVGCDFCKQLKADPITTDIPILFLGLSHSHIERNQAFQAGAVDYLPKPFCYEEASIRIATHLKIRRSQQMLTERNRRLAAEVAGREHLARRLEKQSRYLRIILDNLPQQIFWKDANLTFLGCNRAWADAAGVGDPWSVVGKTDYDLVDKPEDADRFRDQDRQAMAAREAIPHVLIKKLRGDRNGQPIWLDVSRVPMRDEAGKIIGVLGVVEDITERKQAEAGRQQAEEKYRAIVENAIEGIFQTSREGKFVSVNPALAKLLGYSSPDTVLSDVENIAQKIYVEPGRRQEFLAYMDACHEVSGFESEIYRHDGTRCWISESARSIYDEAGQFLHFEGMVRDITERRQAELELLQQRQQSERLLLNILPQKIAQRLKSPKSDHNKEVTADSFESATVLFSDIVGFTELASRVSASTLVTMLNDIFSEFDRLTERHGVEKIKTIGDAYMAVAGVPTPQADHAILIANLALEMQAAIGKFHRDDGLPFQLRIGLHSGPVVAGVIGLRKFIYDLWGDTVNVASRMESLGQPGQIHLSQATHDLLQDRFVLRDRGPVQVKGKGMMTTYWLVDRLPVSPKNSTQTHKVGHGASLIEP